jgi:hypothetical protein
VAVWKVRRRFEKDPKGSGGSEGRLLQVPAVRAGPIPQLLNFLRGQYFNHPSQYHSGPAVLENVPEGEGSWHWFRAALADVRMRVLDAVPLIPRTVSKKVSKVTGLVLAQDHVERAGT